MLKHHLETGYGLDSEIMRSDAERAESFRTLVIARAEASGNAEAAARLRLPGADGYPGHADLPYFCAALGGSILLQTGKGQEVLGEGPLRLHVAWLQRPDGAGVLHDHFAVHQAWGYGTASLLSQPLLAPGLWESAAGAPPMGSPLARQRLETAELPTAAEHTYSP